MISSMAYSTLRYTVFQMIIQSWLCGQNLDSVASNIEMKIAIDWHTNNEMVANPFKFLLMFIGLKYYIRLCIDINGIMVQITDSV